jgi:hypothetical protein
MPSLKRDCGAPQRTTMNAVNDVQLGVAAAERVRERLIAALIPDSLGTGGHVVAPLPVLPTLNRLEETEPGTLLVSITLVGPEEPE